MKDLAVFLGGSRAGTIRQASGLRFTYDDDYLTDEAATPLSLSMPVSEREHSNRVTLSWVNGLLPADREVRARIAERGGVRAGNPAALLTVIGLDCPGAVQVAPVDRADEVFRPAELVEVDADWIRGRLAHLRRDEAAWQIADERWSIGGGQSKFTLARGEDGRWYDPRGAAASTHIVKPGVPTARHQALNEHLSLATLRALRIPAARSEYLDFDGQPALVVERFDRLQRQGTTQRVHAEDLCQALGNQTTYERYGGPSAREVIDLLRHQAPGTPERFTEALMATYLLGSPDGHARNYTVLLAGNRAVLAPLYDVASSLPYDVAGLGLHPPALPGRDPARRAGVHVHHGGGPARRRRTPAPLRRRRRPLLPPRAGPVGPGGPLGLNPCWIRARCTRSRTTSGTACRAPGPRWSTSWRVMSTPARSPSS